MLKLSVIVYCDHCTEKFTWRGKKGETMRHLYTAMSEAGWSVQNRSKHACRLCGLGRTHKPMTRSEMNKPAWYDLDEPQ